MQRVLFLFLLITALAQGQDPSRFSDEIAAIQKKYDTLLDRTKETTVFTGSSSIRIWHHLQEKFPKHQIVNTGFGGSHASDLLHYTNELIVRYKPKKVFIYEGDNDIYAGKSSKSILSDILQIISKIRVQNPAIKVVLIAAKPSIARWNLRHNYKRLNRKLKRISKKDTNIWFVDVWKPMLNKRKVKQDIFFKDGLHMNAKGYAIWYDTIKPFIE